MSRTPEEIRDSIEATRAQLSTSIEQLRSEVVAVTDWRRQIERHKPQAAAAAAVAGLVVGRMLFGRRRKRR